MTLWKTVEELGLQDSIEKNQEVLDQIVELLRSTYQGNSHNFKKKFFTDYFKSINRPDKALENLYELIKYRIENDINYIADLKYLALKFNCTLEEARQYQEEQRIKSAPSLEKFQNSFGEVDGLLRYNLTVEFIKNIPLKSKDPYEVTLGIIKAIPEEGLKYSKNDLITLAESSQDLFEEMSELFSEKLCRDSRRYTFYFKVYEYFRSIVSLEGCLDNFPKYLSTNFSGGRGLRVENIQLKYNCSLEEAKKITKEQSDLKQDRSLEGFIKRHGPANGPVKFKQFKDRCSAAAHKKREKYKDDFRYKVRVNNKRCKEYYTSRGYSEDEAKALVSEYQRLNSGSQVDYWVAKGYSEREAKNKVESLMNRRGASYEYIKEKYPDTWESVIQDRLEAYRKTVGAIDPDWCDEWEVYRDHVRGLTSTSLKLYGDKVEGYAPDLSKDFHVDHMFSVKAGFLSGVKPEIVAHWSNLQVLSAETNLSKGSSCSKDINELFEDYYESLKD